MIVTANYFAVLGVRPYRGRFFDEAEDVAGGPAVAVLSHRAWERLRAVGGGLGAALEINGRRVTVIGVAPREFRGVDPGERDVWLPMGMAAQDALGGSGQYTDRVYWLQLLARRRAGVTQPQLMRVATGRGRDPYAATPSLPLHTLPLRPMFFAESRGENPLPVWLMGVTVAVLLLACATVANLLLAQGVAREQEVAIRLALGASRRRIVVQLLLENVLIACAAAAVAIVLASWGARVIQLLPVPPIARLVDMCIGLLAFAVSVFTVLLFGAAPAIWTARGDLDAVLRRGQATRARTADADAGADLAQLRAARAGRSVRDELPQRAADRSRVEPERVLEVSLNLAPLGLREDQGRELVRAAKERLARVPGVEAAAVASLIPFYLRLQGFRPYSVAVTKDAVWINSYNSFRLLEIEPASGTARVHELWTAAPEPELPQLPAGVSPERRDSLRAQRRRGWGGDTRRIAADATGRIWFTDFGRGRVVCYDPAAGSMIWFEALERRSEPYGIAVTRRGHVWYGEKGTNRVVLLDPMTDERIRVDVPTPGGVVRHIAVDERRGCVWLPLSDTGRIGLIEVR